MSLERRRANAARGDRGLGPSVACCVIGATWHFEQVEGQPRASMPVSQEADVLDEASWPELYRWLGEKLTRVYERVVPKLREAMDRGSAA